MTKTKSYHCESEEVVNNGKRATGIQCLKCKNCGRCFQESYLNNGNVVAYVIGSRHHDMLWQLTDLIYSLNLNITAVYSDDNFAYHDVIPSHTLYTGKINTQKIERKHLSFRTRLKRLARKTICFSKSHSMHNILLGLLINGTVFNCHFF